MKPALPSQILPGTGRCPQGGGAERYQLQTTAKPKRPDPSVGFAATSPFRERIYVPRSGRGFTLPHPPQTL